MFGQIRTTSIIRAAGLLSAIALAVPIAATAATPEDACGPARSWTFTAPVPDNFRTIGVHGFEWQINVTFGDGTADSFVTDNAITISASAPTYRNVLLRLVRNSGLLADGTTDPDISAMQPDQKAAFYAQTTASDIANVTGVGMLIRYETTRNHWTPWFAPSAGPVTSGCVQTTNAVIRKAFGWAG